MKYLYYWTDDYKIVVIDELPIMAMDDFMNCERESIDHAITNWTKERNLDKNNLTKEEIMIFKLELDMMEK